MSLVAGKSCAILGAGVTGLAVARLLVASGARVTIFEKAPVVGGLCRSDIVDGFVYDLAGGHVLFSRDPEVMSFLAGLLGPENLVRSERNTRIFFRGRYVNYPFENGLSDLAKEDNYECLKGFVEAHYRREYEEKGKPRPVSFRDWIVWRFGQGIADLFMFPYNEKIWKTDLSRLSAEWVAGRVPDAPLDDILKTAVGIGTSGYKHQAIFFYPRQGGFQALPDRLAEPLGDCIRLSTTVERVKKTASGFEVNGEPFDELVSTIPIEELYSMLDRPDPRGKEAASSLDFLSLATFLIGLDGRDESNRYSWIYLPHPENGACNRITYLSNYSPNNAPPGTTSVLAEATFREEPKDMEAMAKKVVEDLDRNGLLDKSKVKTLAWRKIRHAYIVFDLDFSRKKDVAVKGLRDLGIHPVGRFGRYEYLNSDMCIRTAFDTAKELIGSMPELPEIARGRAFAREVYKDQNLDIVVKSD